ncbi:MAG TPA: hypothetical protein DCS33_03215 [Gammaproteobacteria bacterium]|nr:hypothetical protein [Gammaproteobacteria bacterium]
MDVLYSGNFVGSILSCWLTLPRTDSDSLSFSERVRLFAANYVRPQLVVFVALTVPLLFFNQQLSLILPLDNIIAIPIVGLLVIPVGFIAVLLTFINEGAAILLLSFA